jgi:hypothetical protein
MDSVKFSDDVKQEDGGPQLIVKKTRGPLTKNLTDEEKLQRLADYAQKRRDYVKRYYQENAAYRAAQKERARVFSRNYYHTNQDYKQRTIQRSKESSKKKYSKIFSESEKTNNDTN